MNCLVCEYSRPCREETAHVDPISPGKVRDEEILCRAGYTMHRKKGNPTIGLIRSKDLASGELSVWRIETATSPDLTLIVNVLRERAPAQQELLWVFGVPAGELRGLIEGQPLCAIDNTDCGPDLGRHAHHCVLAGCDHLGFRDLPKPDEDAAFLSVRRALHEVFSKGKIWAAEVDGL